MAEARFSVHRTGSLGSSARCLKEGTAGIDKVGLDEIEPIGKPAPAELGITLDGGIVVMSGGEDSLIVIHDSVCPNDLAVGVHHIDIFLGSDRCAFIGEKNLGADIADIALLQHFVGSILCPFTSLLALYV